jgi:hypothetical protein
MARTNPILDFIAGAVHPISKIAERWEFWVVILAVAAVLIGFFIAVPIVMWAIYKAGELVGMFL